MSGNQEPYDYITLRWNMRGDGITNVATPEGESIAAVAFFFVPDGNHDKASIDQLVSEFRSGYGRNANKAICSKCYDVNHHVVWDPKPTSLKRHLYTHFDIKCYACAICSQQFVTKDQVVIHVMGHHTMSRDRHIAGGYVTALYPSNP